MVEVLVVMCLRWLGCLYEAMLRYSQEMPEEKDSERSRGMPERNAPGFLHGLDKAGHMVAHRSVQRTASRSVAFGSPKIDHGEGPASASPAVMSSLKFAAGHTSRKPRCSRRTSMGIADCTAVSSAKNRVEA